MMRSTALVPKPGTRSNSSAGSAGDIERETVAVAQRPGELRIDVQRQHAFRLFDDFVRIEAVEPHQPVGLIKPMLPHQGGAASGKARAASAIGLKAE